MYSRRPLVNTKQMDKTEAKISPRKAIVVSISSSK
jgi:hypothetical protein